MLVGALTCLLCGGAARATDDTRAIKQRYRQAAELEKAGDSHHQVTFSTVLPAVGLQRTTVRFVYQSEQADPERDPYLLKHDLVKVSVDYNVAASAQIRSEYLYDARGGLIFYFHREESSDGLQADRFYFRSGKPFKLLQDAGSVDGEPARKTITELSPAHKRQAEAAAAKAKKLRHHFAELLKLEQLQ